MPPRHRSPEASPIRVGLDLVSVSRFARLLDENPAAVSDLFTPREIAYSTGKRRRTEHLAARFAAKEAVLKALGTGLRARMDWTQVEIGHGAGGRPVVHLHGGVLEAALGMNVASIEVSLTHTAGFAAAHALVIRR